MLYFLAFAAPSLCFAQNQVATSTPQFRDAILCQDGIDPTQLITYGPGVGSVSQSFPYLDGNYYYGAADNTGSYVAFNAAGTYILQSGTDNCAVQDFPDYISQGLAFSYNPSSGTTTASTSTDATTVIATTILIFTQWIVLCSTIGLTIWTYLLLA